MPAANINNIFCTRRPCIPLKPLPSSYFKDIKSYNNSFLCLSYCNLVFCASTSFPSFLSCQPLLRLLIFIFQLSLLSCVPHFSFSSPFHPFFPPPSLSSFSFSPLVLQFLILCPTVPFFLSTLFLFHFSLFFLSASCPTFLFFPCQPSSPTPTYSLSSPSVCSHTPTSAILSRLLGVRKLWSAAGGGRGGSRYRVIRVQKGISDGARWVSQA